MESRALTSLWRGFKLALGLSWSRRQFTFDVEPLSTLRDSCIQNLLRSISCEKHQTRVRFRLNRDILFEGSATVDLMLVPTTRTPRGHKSSVIGLHTRPVVRINSNSGITFEPGRLHLAALKVSRSNERSGAEVIDIADYRADSVKQLRLSAVDGWARLISMSANGIIASRGRSC